MNMGFEKLSLSAIEAPFVFGIKKLIYVKNHLLLIVNYGGEFVSSKCSESFTRVHGIRLHTLPESKICE